MDHYIFMTMKFLVKFIMAETLKKGLTRTGFPFSVGGRHEGIKNQEWYFV